MKRQIGEYIIRIAMKVEVITRQLEVEALSNYAT